MKLTVSLLVVLVSFLGLCLADGDHHPHPQPAVAAKQQPPQQARRAGRVQQVHKNPAVIPEPIPASANPSADSSFQPHVEPLPLPIVEPVPALKRQGKQIGAQVRSSPPKEDGSYNFDVKTDDGASFSEEGSQKSLGGTGEDDSSANVKTGSFSYTSPEGQLITVNYIADENGFQPVGDHIPVAPQPSPAIQRGLDLIERTRAKTGTR